jgi:hypothetical protein
MCILTGFVLITHDSISRPGPQQLMLRICCNDAIIHVFAAACGVLRMPEEYCSCMRSQLANATITLHRMAINECAKQRRTIHDDSNIQAGCHTTKIREKATDEDWRLRMKCICDHCASLMQKITAPMPPCPSEPATIPSSGCPSSAHMTPMRLRPPSDEAGRLRYSSRLVSCCASAWLLAVSAQNLEKL